MIYLRVSGPLSARRIAPSAEHIALGAQGAGRKAQGKNLVFSSWEEIGFDCFSSEF